MTPQGDNLSSQQQASINQGSVNAANAQNAAAGNGAPVFAPPSSTMDASAIQSGQTSSSITIPPAVDHSATAANSMATNASIPNPTVQQISEQDTKSTPAQDQQTGILGRIASLMQGNTSLATLQTNQESQAGVPGLTKTVNDLNTQLQGLNDQATALSNAGDQYGAIQNAQRLAETGGNLNAAMSGRPVTKEALLQNNIKLNNISTQALTVKSAIYAAQGNLTLAKDAADKAAQITYDATQQQINYQKALLDQIAPQLSKDEKTQAATLQQDLANQAKQAEYTRQDHVSGLGLVNTALVNNPGDPQAAYAVGQAQKLDPNDPNYLQNVYNLVGKYQKDPMALQKQILDLQATRANIAQSNASADASSASAAKTRLETQQLRNPPVGSISQVTGKPLSDSERTAQGYAARALNSDQTISQLGSQFTGLGYAFSPLIPNNLKSSDQQKYEQAQRDFVNAVLRKESGAAISDSEFQNASKQYFPQSGDSQAVIEQKTANRQQTINNLKLDGGIVASPTTTQPKQIQYQGKTYNVDAQGNMTSV